MVNGHSNEMNKEMENTGKYKDWPPFLNLI